MSKPIAVLGIMTTPEGLKIADEMCAWMQPIYELHKVEHDGSLFELPALKAAQALSIERNEPVLYIHTRGAVNVWRTTIPTRKMWKEEFGRQWLKYFTVAGMQQKPVVVCPFVDSDRETRYNGFVANPSAWAQLDLQPTKDRMDYERLWRDKECTVLGLLFNCDDYAIKDIRNYLYRNYE